MKNILFISMVFICSNSSAQVSQAELDKLMKEAKETLKQIGGDSMAQQKLKELEKNEKQFKQVVTSSQKGAVNTDPTTAKFPSKQTRLLALIPKKTMSRAEVQTYAQQVYTNLKKKIAPQYVQSAEKIIAKLNNNPFRIMEAAVAAAHLNAGEEAVLLATYVASVKPEPAVLNNTAAILTMSGLEPAAITILTSLLPQYNNNPTVLNNIGQAYAALGEKDSAMLFLGRTIRLDPSHTQANYCGGVIEASKGNNAKAIDYLKKSLEGGYNPDASRLVKFLEPDFKLSRHAKPKVKVPEYFNIHKYMPFPVPCQSIADIPRAEAEYKAFQQMLDEEIKKVKKLLNDFSASINSIPMNKGYMPDKNSIMRTSFYKFATEMTTDIAMEHAEAIKKFSNERKRFDEEIKKLDMKYNKAAAAIRQQYKENSNCCGDGNVSCCANYQEMCNKLNALADSYLPKYAALTSDLHLKVLHPYQNFNETAYWHYLTYSPVPPMGVLSFRNVFYGSVMDYLTAIRTIAYTKTIKPCEVPPPTTAGKREGGNVEEPECPINISKKYSVFKFEMDCEKSSFSINAFDEVEFIYSKDNFSKASSLEIAIGIEHKDQLVIIPGYTATLGGGITESMVIEFDKDGKFSDFQIKGGVKVAADATYKPEDKLVKKVIKSTEAWSGSEKFTYTFSMKNGFSYEDGLLRPIADAVLGIKPEVQINKNIKIGN